MKEQPHTELKKPLAGPSKLRMAWGLVILVFLAKLLPFGMPYLPPCGFRWLTGWPCPLCGGIRAAEKLGAGHWGDAWLMNPLVTLLALGTFALGLEAILGGRGLSTLIRHYSQHRLWHWGLGLLVAAHWLYLCFQVRG